MAITVLCTTAVFAHPFTDVAGHWAEAELETAYENGFINGDGDGTFRPDDCISRGEFLKMLATLLFGDVPEEMGDSTHWASRYNMVAQALMYKPLTEAEAIDGTIPGAFSTAVDYDKPIQRWEMAFMIGETFVTNFNAKSGAEYEAIEEVADVYPEAVENAIKCTVGLELMKGDENGKLNANDHGTRAEAAILMNRVLERALKILEEYEAAQAANVKTYEEIPEGHPVVTVEMENGKKFKIELYPEYAPQTVANFVALVEDGFYDGLGFHRVIEGFMAQGGDPTGDGTGNSEFTIKGEFSSNGFEGNTLKHERGVVSMARTDRPDSASCQFFICYDTAETLDGNYAAFGKVIEGMEVVDAFLDVEMEANAMGEMAVPTEPIVMKKVTVKK